jgi:site-specific DNA recombinase
LYPVENSTGRNSIETQNLSGHPGRATLAAGSSAMKNAIIYARVSSREQEREGYSIPAQKKLLRNYAAANGLNVVREFVDIETAKATGRKAFAEMLDFMKKQGCRIILAEKTDRLYRNFRDCVTLEDLDAEIHLVKEGQIIAKDSKSQTKLIHGFHVLLARNYSENLREEVKKGMREKAEQGIYPGKSPIGYRNDPVTRSPIPHSEKAPIIQRVFSLYGTGSYSLSFLRKTIQEETGTKINRAYLEKILKNRFYLGFFTWSGIEYRGKHEAIIDCELFERVQRVFSAFNKPKYRKHEFAFGGLLTCAHDGCTVTAELQKGKYTYYRCSHGKGACDTPYMKEEAISEKLGEILKDIYVPENVARAIVNSLDKDREMSEALRVEQLNQTQQQLAALRARMDRVYEDKLDGAIDEAFFSSKMAEYREREIQLMAVEERLSKPVTSESVLTVARTFELAQKARFLYLTRNHAERGQLLKMLLLNCATDGVSLWPTYRKPFDLIFQRAKNQEWSGREDLNLRPPGPEPGALPG